MNLAEAANLVLTLSLKDQVSKGLSDIDKKMGGLNTSSATLSGGLGKISAGIGVGLKRSALIGGAGVAILVDQLGKGIDSLVELEDVTNQTNAVIKSTGGAAGLTADDVRTLADRLEELTGVDDKVIQSGENVLLTFTNIGKEGFEPAMQAALDMSQAMDQDLQTSILQIGKALNNPDEGLAALTRVGVNFDEATKKIIEDMVAVGDTAGAQQIIIAELNKEFGGSAQASMMGYRGTQLKLKDTVEDLQMAFAEALMPAIENVSDALREFLKDPAVKDGIKKLGQGIAGLFSKENIKGGIDTLKGVFTFLKELPWGAIKDGIAGAADAAKKVVDVFKSLPPGVQAGLIGLLVANKFSGNMLASGIGDLLKVGLMSLRTITAANVTVIGANVVGPGGVPGKGIPAAPVVGLGTAIAAVTVLGAVAVTVKGDTPLPVSADALVQAERDQLAQIQGLSSSIDRDLLGFLRSDADTQALRGQRAQAAFDLIKTYGLMGVQIESRMPADAAAAIRLWAAPLLSAGNQISLTAVSDAAINAARLALRIDAIPPSVRGLMPNLIAQLGATNALKPKLDTIVAKTDAELARMDQIEKFTGISSRKDLSVSLDVRTTLQVSAREVASQLKHIDFLQDRGGD